MSLVEGCDFLYIRLSTMASKKFRSENDFGLRELRSWEPWRIESDRIES